MDFAERLNWLFENVLNDEGRPYRNSDVTRGTAKIGRKVSTTYLSKLRNGEQSNPNWQVVRVLAEFFDVPITFFYEETLSDSYKESLKVAKLLDTDEVSREIATRSVALNKVSKQAILQIITQLSGE